MTENRNTTPIGKRLILPIFLLLILVGIGGGYALSASNAAQFEGTWNLVNAGDRSGRARIEALGGPKLKFNISDGCNGYDFAGTLLANGQLFKGGPTVSSKNFCDGTPPLYMDSLSVYRFTVDDDHLRITNDGQLVMEFKRR